MGVHRLEPIHPYMSVTLAKSPFLRQHNKVRPGLEPRQPPQARVQIEQMRINLASAGCGERVAAANQSPRPWPGDRG